MQWRKSWFCILFLFAFTGSFYSLAQNRVKEYMVDYTILGPRNGLQSAEVICGLQDPNGFLWFGTRNGLHRYDGSNFKVFSKRSHALQNVQIIKLVTDGSRSMFILYGDIGYSLQSNGQVDVMDLQTEQIRPLHTVFPQMPFRESEIYGIMQGGKEEVIFLTTNPFSVWRYNSKNGFSRVIEMTEWNSTNPLFYSSVANQAYVKGDKIVVGLGGHTMIYALQGNRQAQIKTGTDEFYFAIGQGRNGQLKLLHSESTPPVFSFLQLDAEGNISQLPATSQKPYRHLVKDDKLALLKSSNDSPAIFLSPTQGLFLDMQDTLIRILQPDNLEGFNNMQIFEQFADQMGNRWVCTSLGILKFKLKQKQFTHYFTRSQQKIESNNQVREIFVDSNGIVYANVWRNLFIGKPNGITRLQTSKKHILYALVKHQNQFYASNSNLFRVKSGHSELEEMEGIRKENEIFCMYSFSADSILYANNKGFYFYHTSTRQTYPVSLDSARFPLPNFVYRFRKDRSGHIWAVASNGLYEFNEQGRFLQFYGDHPAASQQLPYSALTDILIDQEDKFWIATNGDGLYHWNKKDKSFRHYQVKDGLPSDVLYRIEEDKQKNLWISTDNGLLHFQPESGKTMLYSTREGLSHNEFNRLSSFTAPDGRLFFGGMNGINAFFPEQLASDTGTTDIPLRITAFQQYISDSSRLIDRTASLNEKAQIILKPGDRFFTIEFRLLDFEDGVHQFAYIIEGQDDAWNYIHENNIRVSGLAPGTYRLRIRGKNMYGQWSRSELSLPITVMTPFFAKTWVQGMIAVLLAGIAGIWLFARYKKHQRDKLQLEQTVERRTAELKKALQERELLLKEIHHRVKNNLQIISGLLDLQKEEIDAPESRAVFNEGQSRVRSIALIHQNLYQHEDLAHIEIKGFVAELSKQVADIFEHLGSSMQVDMDIPELYLDIDTGVPLALIINELLTNAYKYGHGQGKGQHGIIHIGIRETSKGHYEMLFRDNGPGIRSDIDFQFADTLGLRLVRGLSMQLGGEAVYTYEDGSVFRVQFKNSETRRAS